MFSKSLNLRLAAVFSGIFLAGTLLLFAGTYLLLYSSVRREHIQMVQSRLLEFWAMYQTGGIAALKAEVVAERNQESRRPFLLRVVATDNSTLFLYVPPQWRHFHFRDLETGGDPARPSCACPWPTARAPWSWRACSWMTATGCRSVFTAPIGRSCSCASARSSS
jgi:hypothetical protein